MTFQIIMCDHYKFPFCIVHLTLSFQTGTTTSRLKSAADNLETWKVSVELALAAV